MNRVTIKFYIYRSIIDSVLISNINISDGSSHIRIKINRIYDSYSDEKLLARACKATTSFCFIFMFEIQLFFFFKSVRLQGYVFKSFRFHFVEFSDRFTLDCVFKCLRFHDRFHCFRVNRR